MAALLVPGELLLVGHNTGAAFLKIGTGARPSALGGGFGVKLKDYRADYTFTPFGDLGNAQRISLGARW